MTEFILKSITYTRAAFKCIGIFVNNGATSDLKHDYMMKLYGAYTDDKMTPRLFRQYAKYVVAKAELSTTPILKHK